MPKRGKTFRVFVSSTFSDLKEERNALQEHVFPRLRKLCMQHGCRFQAIDLRWGISEEAALDQQTMNICIEELHRCQKTTPQPNFIVLLGDRYGWCPLPPQINADEFEEILEKIPTEDKDILLWDEQQPGGRKGWYHRDDNAVPAEYCLRPREVNAPNNATEEEKKAALEREAREWEKIEKKLRSTILHVIDQLGWPKDDSRRTKYEASATHQEILHGALTIPDAPEHVFCFFRKIENLPQDSSAKDFVDLLKGGQLDAEARRLLEELRDGKLRQYLPGNIHDYTATWTSNGITTDHIGTLPETLEDCLKLNQDASAPSSLCVDVWRRLSGIILKEIAKLEAVDPLNKEIADHEYFGDDCAKFFVGREKILDDIDKYLAGERRQPLTVHGASGSGKSALIAKCIQKTERKYADSTVIYRFIGVTPESSDIRALLESLCKEICRRYGEDESAVPSDYKELPREFEKRLKIATVKRILIIFLDALDQLSEANRARSLNWLPHELPENVHLVMSTLPGECLEAARRRLPVKYLVELESLSPRQGNELLDIWLHNTKRTLHDAQKAEVINRFEYCPLPLYLKLAFEEARRWKSYQRVGEKLSELADDIPGIIRNMFARLAMEENHGEVLVSRGLAYLVAGKNGLSEDELLDVLSMDKSVISDFLRRSPRSPKIDKLPVVVWSRLYFDLEPYLTERSADQTALLAFYHRQFGEIVSEEYLAGDRKKNAHRKLTEYFSSQPYQYEEKAIKAPNYRNLSELPFQFIKAGEFDACANLLSSASFLHNKAIAFSIHDILVDGMMLFKASSITDFKLLSNIFKIIRRESRVLSVSPQALLPALHRAMIFADGEVEVGYPPIFESQLLEELSHRLWLQILKSTNKQRGVSSTAPIAIAEFDTIQDLLVVVTKKGECFGIDLDTYEVTPQAAIGDRPIALSRDGQCLTAAGHYVRLWDLTSTKMLSEMDGHHRDVEHGGFIDNTFMAYTWNSSGGFISFAGKVESVTGVAEFRLWAINISSVRSAWDIQTSDMGVITVFAVDPQRKFVLAGTKQGKVFRIPLFLPLNEDTFQFPDSPITRIEIPKGDQYALIGNGKGEIWISWFESGETTKLYEFRESPVVGMACIPDHNTVYAATKEGQIALISIESGRPDWQKQLSQSNILGLSVFHARSLVALWNEKNVQLLDIHSGDMLRDVQIFEDRASEEQEKEDKEIKDVFFDPRSRQILLCETNKFHLVRDVSTPSLSTREVEIPVSSARFRNGEPDFLSYPVPAYHVKVHYWNFVDGEIHLFACEPFRSLATVFGPGSRNCTLGADVINNYHGKKGDTELWDLVRGERIKTYLCHKSPPEKRILVIHEESASIFSASKNQISRVNTIHDEVHVLVDEVSDEISALALNPEGDLVAYGLRNGNIFIISSESGQLYRCFSGHYGKVVGLQFISWKGADCLLSIAEDSTLRCWNIHIDDCIDAAWIGEVPVGIFTRQTGEVDIVMTSGRTIILNFIGQFSYQTGNSI